MLAPGVPLTHPAPHWTVGLARKAGVEVIGDIELFCRERRRLAPDAPFVAITGTNGKSTTTALIASSAASRPATTRRLGGNIGTAILSLEPPRDRTASTWSSARPTRSISRRRSIRASASCSTSARIISTATARMRDYAAVKERLVAGVQHDGTAIVGVDDELVPGGGRPRRAQGKHVVRVSVRRPLPDGIYVEDDADHARRRRHGASRSRTLGGIGSLRGVHNAQNAACAAARRSRSASTPQQIQAGLRSFPGLAHRMEQVGRKGAVLFVNDSKATNADSAAQALACFSDIFWIAGGKPKTGGITSLDQFFPRIRKAYLIGEAAGEFAATLDGKVPYEMAGTLDRAVEAAARDAAASGLKEPVVLLSPACASFDQYPQLRGPRRPRSASWCWRCRASRR